MDFNRSGYITRHEFSTRAKYEIERILTQPDYVPPPSASGPYVVPPYPPQPHYGSPPAYPPHYGPPPAYPPHYGAPGYGAPGYGGYVLLNIKIII